MLLQPRKFNYSLCLWTFFFFLKLACSYVLDNLLNMVFLPKCMSLLVLFCFQFWARLAFCGQEETRWSVPGTGAETMGRLEASNTGPHRPQLANITDYGRQPQKVQSKSLAQIVYLVSLPNGSLGGNCRAWCPLQ
jgi:hypothetical protein